MITGFRIRRPEETGDVLREIRQARGMTLQQAGGRLAGVVSLTTIQSYEHGDRCPTVWTLADILKAYGYEMEITIRRKEARA